MSDLRRRTSVDNVRAEPVVEAAAAQLGLHAVLEEDWAEDNGAAKGFEAECGSCRVTFSIGGAGRCSDDDALEPVRFGRLLLRPLPRPPQIAGGLAAHCRSAIGRSGSANDQGETRRLVRALGRVLDSAVDFAIVCDFRRNPPPIELTEALAAVSAAEATADLWSSQLRAAAVLVRENLFMARAADTAADFSQASHLKCPLLVCHSEASAAEFFALALASAPFDVAQDLVGGFESRRRECNGGAGNGDDSPFISLVRVRDVPEPPGTSSRHCGDDSLRLGGGCVASLVPARSLAAPGPPPPGGGGVRRRQVSYTEHTFHVLPNGDVRVIQSPPKNIVQFSTGEGSGRIQDQRVQLKAASESGAPSHGAAAAEAALPPGDSAPAATLRFRCGRGSLERLLGAHYHIGELVVDAEVASRYFPMAEGVDRLKDRSSRAPLEKGMALALPLEMVTPGTWCFNGVRLVVSSIAAVLKRGYSALMNGLLVPKLPPPSSFDNVRMH